MTMTVQVAAFLSMVRGSAFGSRGRKRIQYLVCYGSGIAPVWYDRKRAEDRPHCTAHR